MIISTPDLDADDNEDHDNEYGAALPDDPAILHADGGTHDLRDSDQVLDLVESLSHRREQLRNGELLKYEGRSTDWGGGGRARLLYDEVRAQLALEAHQKHESMDFIAQHNKAMETVDMVAKLRYKMWAIK